MLFKIPFFLFIFLFLKIHTSKNVHIVLNSHLDLTWLMTAQELYYGEGFASSYCAKCLFDDLINILSKDPKRTFTISELFFFLKYYEETKSEDPKKNEKLFELIKKKQLILGQSGVSIYDQATTHYEDIIDQMSYGMRKIYNLFNLKIEHGWALDVFGQSFTNTFILKKFGIKSLIFDRVSEIERQKPLEFFWGSKSLMVHKLPHTYGDDKNNYKEMIDLKSLIDKTSELTPNQNEIMLVFSDDFKRWTDLDYEKIEDHIEYFTNMHHDDLNLFFSSPETYFEALERQENLNKIETKEQYTDFFPLIGPSERPWVGFYTTRPNLKLMIRRFGVLSRSLKNLISVLKQTIKKLQENTTKICVDDMDKHIGYLLHHDNSAGTVTSKVEDFVKTAASKAEENCRNQLSHEDLFENHFFCNMLDNRNFCILDYLKNNSDFKDKIHLGANLTMRIFNPGQNRKDFLVFRIPDININVRNLDGSSLESDSFCEFLIELECYLYIHTYLHGFQFQELILQFDNQTQIKRNIKSVDTRNKIDINLNFEFPANLEITPNFTSFIYSTKNMNKEFMLEYKYYESRKANKCPFFDSDGNYIYSCPDESGTYSRHGYAGAYVMRLETGQAIDFKEEMKISGFYYETKFFTRILICYNENSIVSSLTFFKEYNKNPEFFVVDVNSFINDKIEIDFSSEGGREIVFCVKLEGLDNKGEFFTDSNGLFPIKRQRTHENKSDSLDIPNNFYPVVSEISINDENSRNNKLSNNSIKIFNDRPQGGTSYRDGEIEMLIARYINTDDSLGLKENITFQEKLYLNHKIVFQSYNESSKNEEISKISQMNNFEYLIFLNKENNSRKFMENSQFSNIFSNIPHYIKINLVPVENKEIIIRVQNILDDNNKDIDKLLEEIIEKMKRVCQRDNEDCLYFECKKTLLDGFSELKPGNEENYPYDITTLQCKMKEEVEKNETIFKKQKLKKSIFTKK